MRTQALYLLVGLALGWLILLVGYLLWRPAYRRWRAWRYGTPLDPNLLLTEWGRKVAAAPDGDALSDLLVRELPRALHIERAALLLPEEYDLVAAGETGLRLPVSHAAVRRVAAGGEAQRADRDRLRRLIEQGKMDLRWTRVWVPLMRGAELRGLWLLGARADGAQYAPEDLRWLTTIGRQGGVVLETIRYAERERQAASEIRTLYRQMVETREVERGRLARELHDGVLQDLCAVTRDLKALDAQAGDAGTSGFDELADRSGATVRALRAVCHDLRPPLLQQDLGAALRALVEELDARSAACLHLEVIAGELHLPDDVALAIFRITQEALNNAIQHADASEIGVRLTAYPDHLRLTVADDGRGITGSVEPARFVAQGHFGLAGMRERAAMIGGEMEVQTAPDYGTVVVLKLPC